MSSSTVSPADRMQARARAHRRRFLRHLGVRAADLDAVARAKLGAWAIAQAALEHEDVGTSRYWIATKVTRGLLRELEEAVRGVRRPGALDGILRAAHGNGAKS